MTHQFKPPAPTLRPTSLPELEPAERLIVWAFRHWALALEDDTDHHMCLVWNEFARQFGAADGRAALSGFIAVIRALQEYARRNMHHHQPCCPCLGADEMWLVRLVGSIQRGDRPRARRLAERMVRADGVGDLLDAAGRLARAMRGHAVLMPFRDGEDGPAGPVPVILH